MKHALILAVLLGVAACSPLRQEGEFHDQCLNNRLVVMSRAISPTEEAAQMASCQRMAAMVANHPIGIRNREIGAMAAAVVLGSASDALAEHNFYVYDVPRAARYLRR